LPVPASFVGVSILSSFVPCFFCFIFNRFLGMWVLFVPWIFSSNFILFSFLFLYLHLFYFTFHIP
jgi:hypothetical protein